MTTLPPQVDQLIDRLYPDALWVDPQRHDDMTYTIWVLDADYTYTEWLCCLSLDNRWTLSPRGGPWDNAPSSTDDEGARWRKRANPTKD